jgi:hypothetical protein
MAGANDAIYRAYGLYAVLPLQIHAVRLADILMFSPNV